MSGAESIWYFPYSDLLSLMNSGLSLDGSVSSSSSLLGRLRQQDPQARWRLSKLYGPLVYRWVRQAGLQEQDVADVAQDVFRAVAADLPNYRGHRQHGVDQLSSLLGSFKIGCVIEFPMNKMSQGGVLAMRVGIAKAISQSSPTL